MVVYGASDPDLRTFAVAPLTLKAWLRHSESLSPVSLRGYWRDLDAILGAATSAGSASRLTPARADWTFAGAADHGAYALSSVSTRELLHSIDQVTRAEVEAYVRQRWTMQESRAGDSPVLTPVQMDTATDELLAYLARLRGACLAAIVKGHGLLLALWETP